MKRIIGIALLALAVAGCIESSDHDKINGSIDVAAGEATGEVSTVNGSIRIGDGATVTSASTVNGSITLGDRAKATELATVNGLIKLGVEAKVSETIDVVNGSISLENSSDVTGSVQNVNGKISLNDAHVGGGVGTVTGDIEVGAHSRVEGGLKVSKAQGFNLTFGKKPLPRVVIGPGAKVDGTLKFEREVKLYVSDTATIGPVEGATPIKFSGDQPTD